MDYIIDHAVRCMLLIGVISFTVMLWFGDKPQASVESVAASSEVCEDGFLDQDTANEPLPESEMFVITGTGEVAEVSLPQPDPNLEGFEDPDTVAFESR